MGRIVVLFLATALAGCGESPSPAPEDEIRPEFAGIPREAPEEESVPARPTLRDEPPPQSLELVDSTVTALGWLVRHQSPDGSWSADRYGDLCREGRCTGQGQRFHEVGATGLALLGFLGCWETSGSRPRGRAVLAGLRYLKRVQAGDGCFGPRTSPDYLEQHALATLAMAGHYGETRSPEFRSCAQDGIQFLLSRRNPGGAWGTSRISEAGDLSVSVWALMALLDAGAAELEVDGDALAESRLWLDSLQLPDPSASGDLAETSMVACMRIWCGAERGDAAVEQAADRIEECLTAERGDLRNPDARTLYFGTLGESMLSAHGVFIGNERQEHGDMLPGTKRWFRWFEAKEEVLLSNLKREKGCVRGSLDPLDPWCSRYGRVGGTALAAIASHMN